MKNKNEIVYDCRCTAEKKSKSINTWKFIFIGAYLFVFFLANYMKSYLRKLRFPTYFNHTHTEFKAIFLDYVKPINLAI